MAVEIKELIIRAVLDPGNTDSKAGISAAPTESNLNQDEVITACVEQVLKILKTKKDR